MRAKYCYRCNRAKPLTQFSKDIAEDWIKQYVAKKKLRTQPEIERILRVYVYPAWVSCPS